MTKTLRKVIALAITAKRTPAGSVRVRAAAPRTEVAAAPVPAAMPERSLGSDNSMLMPALSSTCWDAAVRPALQPVDQKNDQERGDQHHHRDRGRVGIAELGQPDHDQERRDLRDVRQIASDED